MRARIAIVYNEPYPSRYDIAGEQKAILGVLEAVEAVHQALTALGYDVTRVPLVPPRARARRKLKDLDVDLVFNLFEGFCGHPKTEALVPEVLEELNIPYTGCPAPVLKLALDKVKVKVILEAAGIRTPDFQLLNLQTLPTFRLTYPCIVKPRAEDASHGLSPESLVRDFAALQRQVDFISRGYGGSALVEEFIDGREFDATVLGNSECTSLPVSEITYSLPPGMPKILTFAAKWEPDSLYFQGTSAVCPAHISDEKQAQIAEIAIAVFRLLGCQSYVRVDMRMDQEGKIYVLEVNPNPDISPMLSGAVRQAEAAGMNYERFIQRIIEMAPERKPQWNSGFAACPVKTSPA